MEWTTIPVSSVTNAMRGKSVLEQRGLKVQIQRAFKTEDTNGCGYQLLVRAPATQAREILKNAGIRMTGGDNTR